jgi:hypothetical protein
MRRVSGNCDYTADVLRPRTSTHHTHADGPAHAEPHTYIILYDKGTSRPACRASPLTHRPHHHRQPFEPRPSGLTTSQPPTARRHAGWSASQRPSSWVVTVPAAVIVGGHRHASQRPVFVMASLDAARHRYLPDLRVRSGSGVSCPHAVELVPGTSRHILSRPYGRLLPRTCSTSRVAPPA